MATSIAKTCDKGHINGMSWRPGHPQILFCVFCSSQGTYYTDPCPPDDRRSLRLESGSAGLRTSQHWQIPACWCRPRRAKGLLQPRPTCPGCEPAPLAVNRPFCAGGPCSESPGRQELLAQRTLSTITHPNHSPT
jgi:hypothetical protein